MPDITYDVGRVSFVMKGAWNLATSYEKLDAVSYNGSLYIAKQDVPGGTAITNTTYWQLAVEKGDKGDTGGVDSVNGQQGDVWFPDSRQLISDGYTTDTEPFLMKGNDSDSDRFELAKKLGNTVCVNDMFNPANALSWTQDGITVSFNSTTKKYTISGTAAATIDKNIYGSVVDTVKGRKYAFISGFSGGSGSLGSGYELYVYGGNFGTYVGMNKINESTNGGGFAIYLKCQSGVTIPTQTFSIDIPDISLWFGSNDRIPSDLLSHPENWGDYYAGPLDYEPGRLESADGTVLTSFGTDGVTVLAEVDTGGEPLYGDGTEENSDVKLPSGEITRKRDRVDMGTLTYQLNTGLTGVDRFRVINYAPIKSCNASNTPSLKCVKFVASDMVTANAQFAVWVVGQDSKDIYFYTPAGTYAGADAFKTAMSGIYLDFPLATPSTEQGTAFEPLVATVKNGVLSWTNTKGIPVGHESHYFENLRKRVEDRLPDPPSGDGTYRLTCTISGGVKTYSWEA